MDAGTNQRSGNPMSDVRPSAGFHYNNLDVHKAVHDVPRYQAVRVISFALKHLGEQGARDIAHMLFAEPQERQRPLA